MIPPRIYTYQGRQYTARQLAEIAGCTLAAMKSRLKTNSADDAVALGGTRPVGVQRDAWRYRTWEHQGQQLTVAQLAALAQCPVGTMRTRLRKHPAAHAVALGPQKPQGRNPGRVERHFHHGDMLTIKELAVLAGCSHCAMRSRLRRMNAEAAVALGGGGTRLYPYQGRQCSAGELAKLAGVARNTMLQRLEVHAPENAVAMGPTPRRGAKAGNSNVRQPRRVQLGIRTYTIQQLADLAGCSYVTMYYRLRRHTPERAVAMGAERDPRGPKEPRTVPMPTPALRAPRAAGAKASAKASARASSPACVPAPTPATRPTTAQRTARLVAFAPLAPDSKLAQQVNPPAPQPDAEVVVPANVKRTVAEPKPDHRYTTDRPPSTFGRIGQYLPDETHLARVYGGRR